MILGIYISTIREEPERNTLVYVLFASLKITDMTVTQSSSTNK